MTHIKKDMLSKDSPLQGMYQTSEFWRQVRLVPADAVWGAVGSSQSLEAPSFEFCSLGASWSPLHAWELDCRLSGFNQKHTMFAKLLLQASSPKFDTGDEVLVTCCR